MKNEKQLSRQLCLTLDLENDYGRFDSYHCFSGINILESLIKKFNIRFTTFVTGKVLEDRPDIVERLRKLDSEFGLHSYSHTISRQLLIPERLDELNRAVEAYQNYFHKKPVAYRAPQGMIFPEEIEALFEKGFKIDASLFPSYRPGLFDNRKAQTSPFQYENGLWEIPFAVIPKLRLPIALSYMQFFGWNSYKLFFKLFGVPSSVVCDFHMHNLVPTEDVRKLPVSLRLFYSRNHSKGVQILDEFIRFMHEKNYDFVYISQLSCLS